jgi:peroxiredoxin
LLTLFTGAAATADPSATPALPASDPAPPSAQAPSGHPTPSPGTGALRARYRDFALSLVSTRHGGGIQEQFVSREGVVTVPAGDYNLLQWRVNAVDAAGRRWQVKGNRWPEPVTVTAGAPTPIPLATPLRAYLQVVDSNGQLHFHLEYSGPKGERCREITMNGRRPPIPWVRILDRQNRSVARLQFLPKCGGTCLLKWRPGPKLTGRFRALLEADLGPFPLDPGAGIELELKAGRLVHSPPRVGHTAPDFTLSGQKGNMVRLSFLRKRPVLLCFFCRCPLCRTMATKIAQTKALADGTQVVVVASDAAVTDSDEFRQETGLQATYLSDSPPVVGLRYRSEACPRCWLIDAAGVIRYSHANNLVAADTVIAGLLAATARWAPPAAVAKRQARHDAARAPEKRGSE